MARRIARGPADSRANSHESQKQRRRNYDCCRARCFCAALLLTSAVQRFDVWRQIAASVGLRTGSRPSPLTPITAKTTLRTAFQPRYQPVSITSPSCAYPIRQDSTSSFKRYRSWKQTDRSRIRPPLGIGPSPICRGGGHFATGTDVVSNPFAAPDDSLEPARPARRYSAVAHNLLIKLATSDSLKCLISLKIAVKAIP